jgi:RNA polymerase sigma-70 factor, ECF subfamily
LFLLSPPIDRRATLAPATLASVAFPESLDGHCEERIIRRHERFALTRNLDENNGDCFAAAQLAMTADSARHTMMCQIHHLISSSDCMIIQTTMDNDLALVHAAQRGDKRAFAQLVETYERRVYNLARKMMRNPQDAEDVLQETFLSVYRHLDTFRSESSFSTWLYRIAMNASLMKLRGHKEPPISLDEPIDAGGDGALPREIVDWGITPEEALLNGETRAQMDAAVAELPEILRAVFVLREIEGLNVEETANVLGISVPNVKTRLHRARMLLREILTAYFKERGLAQEEL